MLMRIYKVIIFLVLLSALVGIRMAEEQLFYDPFLKYFKAADKNEIFPSFEWLPLVASHLLRFILNLLVSVALVQLLFMNCAWTVQAAALMVMVFLITFPLYLYCVYTNFEVGYLFSFYMRRFVIQPLILLLIVPLFYYRRMLLRSAR